MEKITKDMLELDGIKGNEKLTVAVNKHHSHMTTVLSLWCKIQRIMEKIGRLPKETIAEFRKHRDDLKRAVNNMVKHHPPLPGDDNPLSHPTQIKWHVILGKDLDAQITLWEIMASADEENTESAHARDNHYKRRFGNLRGATKQKAKTRQKLFDGSAFIQKEIK